MIRVSKEFIAKLKVHELPAYRIAQQAELDPVVLSQLINGIIRTKPNDKGILAVGKVLGVAPSECFEVTEAEASKGG